MITLASPFVLIALPLPWLIWRFLPAHRQQVAALRIPFFRHVVSTSSAQSRAGAVVARRTRLQMVAAIAVWVLLVVALAQPQRLGAPVEVTRSARDVVLAIDISGSMDIVDFEAPDGTRMQRLTAVRDVVRDFISHRDGDRIALIVFGTNAYLQAPLTEDLATIIDLVDQTEVGMAGPHTAIGDAIGLAIRTFEASDVDQRLMVLLSDGADTGSRMSPISAAEIARTRGVEIHTIAVGDPEADGENRVDTRTLADIAARTGGATFNASDMAGLSETYARIDQLAPRLVERLSHRPTSSLAHLCLGLAALIGMLALVFLSTTGMRRARV